MVFSTQPSGCQNPPTYKILHPELNRIRVFNKYTLLVLAEGSGYFQVDFRNYHFDFGKAIFLSPGQYFQLLSGSFQIKQYEFTLDNITKTINSRYLFKHLVSLGYIDMTHTKSFHLDQLRSLDLAGQSPELLSGVINQWIELNPFNASENEVNLLFDIKEVIDDRYTEPITVPYLSKTLDLRPYYIQRLAKEKLQQTVHGLQQQKILLEAQRKAVFTGLTTKEMAYQLGFNEPAYFNRFFKKQTAQTPYQFRECYQIEDRDSLMADLYQLIDTHYKTKHTISFYADQLHMSAKTLAKKVRQQLGTSIHRLIRDKLLSTAKKMLVEGRSIGGIAFELGFKEPNHFSSFFKTYTGQTPSAYSAQLT